MRQTERLLLLPCQTLLAIPNTNSMSLPDAVAAVDFVVVVVIEAVAGGVIGTPVGLQVDDEQFLKYLPTSTSTHTYTNKP
jgi:hypothetical protein